jgi:hypothetical protein
MSTMQQIMANQKSGIVGMKDAMHRTVPGSSMIVPMARPGESYGTHPITGAPVTDKFAAQELLNPSPEMQSAFASYQRGSMPMMPARGGGGGGGGGRMGPREDRQKIMRTGPRTTSDFVAKTGGLSPQRASTLDAAYGRGDMRPMGGMPPVPAPALPGSTTPQGGGTLAPEQGMVWNDETGWNKPQMMAKGGTMKQGKPYLVGEEGPELILPREDGSMHVLPHDVTKQVLPAMRDVTPRAQGGPMMPMLPTDEVYTSPGGTFAGFTSPSGSGFASRIPTRLANTATAPPPPAFMVDPMTGMQVQPGNSADFVPDTITGPWSQVGAPVTPEMEQSLDMMTQGRALRLPAMGATTARERFDSQTVTDGLTGDTLPLADMRGRVMDRASMLMQSREDARVQQDLAARAARAPLGTPVLPPTTPGGLPMIPGMERNIERFLRTPQGAMFALEQGTEDARMRQRMEMTQPVPLGDTGDFVVPFTGQVIQRQGDSRQMTPEEAQRFGLVPLESKNGVITYGKPKASGGTSRLTYIPEVPSAVAGQPGTPARVFDPATGEFWDAGQPRPSRPSAEVGGAQTESPAAPYNPFQ